MRIIDRIDKVLNEGKKTKFKKPSWKELKKRIQKLKKIKFKKPSKPKTAMTITGRIKKSARKLFGSLFKKMRLTESSDVKVDALASFLDIESDDVTSTNWGFDADGGEYMVLTDEEADKAVKEYIESSIWAFNNDFLLSQMTLEDINKYYGFDAAYYNEDTEEYEDVDDPKEAFYLGTGMDLEEFIKEIQGKYEDGNQELLRLIDDIDDFVEDAVSADGRGHFLSPYDGREEPEGDYYIYRTN